MKKLSPRVKLYAFEDHKQIAILKELALKRDEYPIFSRDFRRYSELVTSRAQKMFDNRPPNLALLKIAINPTQIATILSLMGSELLQRWLNS